MLKTFFKYCIVTSIFSVHIICIYAQSFTAKRYTTVDGLSDNYILCVYQDSYGYLWIGTAHGLNRFDGKRFVTYGLKNGLPSMLVDRIYEDRNHRLWVGTRKGMAEMKEDSFYTYTINDKKKINFVSGFIEPGNGSLWATTDNGVYKLNSKGWEKIKLYPGKENAGVGGIIQTKGGLFIGYENNTLIQLRNDGSYKVILSVNTKGRPYYSSLFSKNDTVFISTYSGLQYWNGYKWIKQFEDTLSRKFIYSSFCDKHNRFWLGTKEDGLLCIMNEGSKIIYRQIPLAFNLVSNYFEDREGNIWIAGFEGLVKISASPYYPVTIPAIEKITTLRNCIVMPTGNILLSSDNGNLLLVKKTAGHNTTATIIGKYQLKTPIDFIDYYTFDGDQRMWFTTRDGQLGRLSEKLLEDMTSIINVNNGPLRGIAYNNKTKKLFVCADSILLTGDEHLLDTFLSSNGRKTIPIPWKIIVDPFTGSMLVQTVENGLFLISPAGDMHSLGNELNLSLSCIETNEKGEAVIWAAYNGRHIKKYLWKNAEAPVETETITVKDGMPDNKILDLKHTKNGKLWIATTKGVTLMQKDSLQNWIHRDFEINEAGLPMTLSFSKIAVDYKNNVWMSIKKSLIQFNSENISIPPFQIKTVIEKVSLFDRPTNWTKLADSVGSYRMLPVKPVLNHKQNSISIIYNAPLFENNALPEYTYRLLPEDTAWSNPTASNLITFQKLSPGRYQFQVRSRIKGFDWSTPSIFSFTIKKPFWETWWFRSLVILLTSAMIAFIFRFRINQLKKRSEMQNQVREMEMRALKAQMNPHFIHNALNSIQSLIINDKSYEASRYISKFARLLRQVLESADKNLIPLDKELYSLKLYVDLEKLRMNMDIDYSEYVVENIIASEIKIPPLILQPFVENALWHGLSNKEGSKKILLSIKEKDGWIICEITDNGIGRKKAAEAGKPFPEGSFSKAVAITTRRLLDFNKANDIEPVSFIDHIHENESLGTTVIVRIKAHSKR